MAARNYAINAWKGYLCVILAATMWGTNGVVAKYLFNHGVSSSMLVQIRSTLAFLILFSALALFKKDLIRFTGRDALFWAFFVTPWEVSQQGLQLAKWPYFLYVVVVGTVLPFGLYFQGIKHIRATRASITSILEPVVAGVVSFFLLHERFSYPQIIGGISVIVAIVLLQAHDSA